MGGFGDLESWLEVSSLSFCPFGSAFAASGACEGETFAGDEDDNEEEKDERLGPMDGYLVEAVCMIHS